MALIDTILQKGHSSYQEYHLTKVAPNVNGTSQKWHLTKMASQNIYYWFSQVATTNTFPIKPTPTVI